MPKKILKEKYYSTEYQCIICNNTFPKENDAVNCEKSHTCKHSNINYDFIDSDGYAWSFNVCGIRHYCADCQQELNKIDFEKLSQEQIKTIYNILNK